MSTVTVLLGTTNASKITRFRDLLDGYDLTFLTLNDRQIREEPPETGATPEENAILKAAFYGRFFDTIICNDSGLYLDGLPLSDPRQPGLHIRTPRGGERLDDDGMIAHYAALAHELGGRVLAYYQDGIAVFRGGKIFSFMENSEATRASAFYLTDTPSPKRQPGWPLNSISLNRHTLTYFSEAGNNKYDAPAESVLLGDYRKRLVAFLVEALGL